MNATGECWYFAYGSNLDPSRMSDRTGSIRNPTRARLPGYRLVFNKLGMDGTGKANILPADESQVFGVIYRCGPEAMRELDRHEGVPTHYRREPVTVLLDEGDSVDAIAYVAQPDRVREGLHPAGWYLAFVLAGAKHHALPEEYVREIQSHA